MSLEQIIVLALIQGITEFLPISSSGHLILVPALTGWPDQGVVTDMVTNLGTLARRHRLFLARCRRHVLRGAIDLVAAPSHAQFAARCSMCHRHHSDHRRRPAAEAHPSR